MTTTTKDRRLYIAESETVVLLRLATLPGEEVRTQWGCQRPWLERPTHRQLIVLAHLRGVEHTCEEVCSELATP